MSSCGDEWKTQDGITEYTISDDGNVQVDIPFDFPYGYGGNNFTTSWMFSNGVVGFMSPTGSFCCNGIDVENGNFTNYTGLPYFSYSIAALWTDLIDLNVDFDGDGVDDTGFFTQEVDTDGDGQTDTLRYLWRNISEYYDPTTANTFGTQIDANGGIEIHHFQIEIKNHAVTVGVFGDVTEGEIEQYQYYSYQEDYVDDTYTTYTFDLASACQANPLISSVCSGYEEAYAELVYQQQCAANPLYDIGCSGYEQAYYEQQCSADPLYAETCPGYEEAYYTQQCRANPLYDIGCTGYEQAYYNQQCELNPLYDTGCSGYEQAYYETYIRPTLEEQANEAAGVDTDGVDDTPSTVVITTEDFSEPQILDDPVIDNIVFDEPEVIPYEIETNQTTDFGNPPEDVAEIQPTQNEESTEVETTIDTLVVDDETEEGQEESIEVASIEEEREDERETESSSDVDESVDSSGDDESSDAGQESDRETEDGGDGGTESSEPSRDAPTESEKKKSKKKKLKEIAAKKAAQLANRMSEAATLEAQQAVQLQILRLIGFNPDFSAYQNVSITQPQFYAEEQLPDAKIPNSRRGLRNGLAQQLLHEKMVDMQYE